GQIEATLLGHHGQPQPLRWPEQGHLRCGQARRFPTKHKYVPGPQRGCAQLLMPLGGQCKAARWIAPDRLQSDLQAVVYAHARPFVVIEPGTLELLVVKYKTERADKVQIRTRVGGQSYDIASIGRDFRLYQNDVKHRNP